METATPDVSAPPSGATETAAPSFSAFKQERNSLDLGRTPKTKAADPEPAKPSSAEGEEPEEKAAPASEAGKPSQEHGKRTTARDRRTELSSEINDLLSQRKQLRDELESLRKGNPDAKPDSSPAPQSAAKEQPKDLERPKRPVFGESGHENETWDQFDARRDEYTEQLADFKATTKVQEYRAEQQQAAQARELQQQVSAAGERYGEEARGAIGQAVEAINTSEIPADVKAVINASDVLVDLLYVAGSKPDDLAAFVSLAKSNPLAAVKQIAVMEHLIKQELAGKAGKPAHDATERETTRDESGKFVAAKPPEKQKTQAPPIGTELSGRGAAPPDQVERAAKDGNFRSFKELRNKEDLERRRR